MNNNNSLQAIILAAGQSSRFKTGITKLATPICGQPMILFPLKLMAKLSIPATVVVGHQKDIVKDIIIKHGLTSVEFAEQKEQLGTGHAVVASKATWHADNLLIMNGDTPLVDTSIMQQLSKQHFANNAAISFVVAHHMDNLTSYGRLVKEDKHIKIVEAKHFTKKLEECPYVNAGIYIISRSFLESTINTLEKNANTNEFYLTDLVEIASRNKMAINVLEANFQMIQGANNFIELANVEQWMRRDLLNHWMLEGVRFIAPHTVHIETNVSIGRGTIIGTGVQLFNGTRIGEFCTIEPFAILQDSVIENNATIGAHSVIEHTIVTKNAVLPAFTHRQNPHKVAKPTMQEKNIN